MSASEKISMIDNKADTDKKRTSENSSQIKNGSLGEIFQNQEELAEGLSSSREEPAEELSEDMIGSSTDFFEVNTVTEEFAFEEESMVQENADHKEDKLYRVTIQYEPFSKEKVQSILDDMYGQNEGIAYEITVVDGGTCLRVSAYESKYRDLMQMPLMMGEVPGLMRGDGAVLRRPDLAYYARGEQVGEAFAAAEKSTEEILERLGYKIAYMDHTYLSADTIKELQDFSYQIYKDLYDNLEEPELNPWENDGIIYFVARQSAGQTLVESYTEESLIEVAYSVSGKSIVYINTYMPPYNLTMGDKADPDLLSKEEAIQFGEIILHDNGYGTGEIVDAELVYAHYVHGAYRYETNELELWPAWKLSYETTSSGESVIDYIMIDAETGRQLNNQTPLF